MEGIVLVGRGVAIAVDNHLEVSLRIVLIRGHVEQGIGGVSAAIYRVIGINERAILSIGELSHVADRIVEYLANLIIWIDRSAEPIQGVVLICRYMFASINMR